jgi:hypothetical protein
VSLPLRSLVQVVSSTRITSKGSGVIAGVTLSDGSAASCRVMLFTANHVLTGYRRTGSDGVYSFAGVRSGRYYLVIGDDNQGTRRSKVEHVEIT